MACNEKDPNCVPCRDCPPMPDPVLPRCDIALVDGTFTNTTVVVEDGCIIRIDSGRAPQYTPDVCCAEPGGGGGGNDEPCDCPPGDDGENATIDIGQVQSVAPNAPARVRNVGTQTNAVLEFEIPRGVPGDNTNLPDGATSDLGGIDIANGIVRTLPAAWPPVLYIQATPAQMNVAFTASAPDPQTGVVTFSLDLSQFQADERQWTNTQITNAITPVQAQITSLQDQVSALQAQIAAINSKLATCCP